jgi:hypothetical protein
MQDSPSAQEMIESVKEFLEKVALPELKGHTAYSARVAATALGIVARELEITPNADAEEKENLKKLLKTNGSLKELNQILCRRIRSDELDLTSPGLAQHLLETTLKKVEIDQPTYSGLRVAKEKNS